MIIGITGTIGAGKGTVVDFLTREKGFTHYSVRAWLLREIKQRGMPENRDSMFTLANSLRALNGPSFVTDQLFLQAKASGGNCVIESIRTPGEIISLRNKGRFILFAVDADPEIRYQRILARQSETDRISYETFLENEARETGSGDPNMQNLHACIAMADYVFQNNNTISDLNNKVDEILTTLTKS